MLILARFDAYDSGLTREENKLYAAMRQLENISTILLAMRA